MSKVSRTKKQHYVPRFYLSRFSDNRGLIWTYKKPDGEVIGATASATAVEQNFYSPKDTSGGYIDDIEAWLSSVESKAAQHYDNLISGTSISNQAKADMSVFFASLHTRSPALVTAAATLYADMIDLLMELNSEDPNRFAHSVRSWGKTQNREFTNKEIEDLRSFVRDKDRYTISVRKQTGLTALAATDELSDIFYRMNWIVVNCAEQHIITSDNPVVRVVPPDSYHPIYGDGGFMNKNAIVTVPMTPSKVLEMGWKRVASNGPYSATKQQARLYNRQRAFFAEDRLFSSVRDSGICALARKYSQPGVRITSGRDNRAQINVKRHIG